MEGLEEKRVMDLVRMLLEQKKQVKERILRRVTRVEEQD